MKTLMNLAATRALFVLCLCSCLWSAVTAQAATYAYRNDVFSYDTPSAAANVATWHASGASPGCTQYPNGDDDFSDVVFANATTPANNFTFTFAGVAQTGVRIYSNGMLAFGSDTSGFWRTYTNTTLPITASAVALAGCTNGVPSNLMSVYWRDIVAGTANNTTGASVQYELLGTAPSRRLVISWVNVKLYGQTARYNFQVALYESPAGGLNSNFKYQYTTGSSDGSGATVGVQVNTTDSTLYSYNQVFIDPVAGTAILWYPANQLAGKGAEYRFDEAIWNGTAGEVKDTSGSGQNAVRVGTATNVPGGKLCRGGSFTNNTSNSVIDAVATPIVPASVGSLDFWFQSNVKWSGGGATDQMLVDATAVAGRPFYLMKTSGGKLKFVVTDSATTVFTVTENTARSFAAATWQHVGVSWNMQPGTNQTLFQIFLNGALEPSTTVAVPAPTPTPTAPRTTSTGSIAALATLYIGDNRTSGVTPSGGTPNSANGFIDEVYIYPTEINATQAAADMALTRPSCGTFDHFHIIHAGSVVNCAAASITIEAHTATHALFSLSGTTMNMSTSTNHGTWSGISAINPVSNGTPGNGSYVFANEASIVLGLTDSFAESLNINLGAGAVTENTGAATTCVSADYTVGTTCDANLIFADSGFLINVPDHSSEVSQTVTVSAVKKADNSLACTPAFASVSKSVQFTCGYANPITGTLPVRVGGAALNSANNVAAACDGTGQAVNLAFNASGVATSTLQYADAGQMSLTALYTAGGLGMTGTGTFIAAPASFAFSGITAAPIKAGANFSATVTANNAAATPAPTPNFGKETTTPAGGESATLTHAKYQPTGANSGNLTSSVGAFSGGAATATLAWDEVGIIDLTATLTNTAGYLGSGLKPTGTTGTTGAVGRFIPHHFDTVVTQGCNAAGYTYSAQPFTVDVFARNLAGGQTLNYDGTGGLSPIFAKVVTLSDANIAGVGAFVPNPTTAPASAFTLGKASPKPVYVFASRQTVPTTIKLRAMDTDSVSSLGFVEGTAKIESGRAKLGNAHGSEVLALPMVFRTEYWNNGWVINSDDACTGDTALGAANAVSVTLTSPPATCIQDTGNPGLSGAGCAAAGPVVQQFTNGPASFGGNFNLWLKAPLAKGAVTVTGNVPTWLQFPWLGAGAINPAGRATFGVFKGANEFIYMRENY